MEDLKCLALTRINANMPPEGGMLSKAIEETALFLFMLALDADAKFAGLLRAGVGIEVVGRALLESVAVAQLCADIDAHGGNGDSDREPGNDTESSRSGFSGSEESGTRNSDSGSADIELSLPRSHDSAGGVGPRRGAECGKHGSTLRESVNLGQP
jgi:hypothetical protein